MSILIPGVEMPKYKHHLTITVWPNGHATCLLYNRDDNIRTIETVKAVPVPPHGDLTDRDAYRDEFMSGVYDLCDDDPDNCRANAIIDLFDSAPTIIPAEEE